MKRGLALVLALVLLIGGAVCAVPVGAEETQTLWGDVDGNGKRNTTDARMTLQYAAGRTPVGDYFDPSVADVDENGKVNTTDARLILQSMKCTLSDFPKD